MGQSTIITIRMRLTTIAFVLTAIAGALVKLAEAKPLTVRAQVAINTDEESTGMERRQDEKEQETTNKDKNRITQKHSYGRIYPPPPPPPSRVGGMERRQDEKEQETTNKDKNRITQK